MSVAHPTNDIAPFNEDIVQCMHLYPCCLTQLSWLTPLHFTVAVVNDGLALLDLSLSL